MDLVAFLKKTITDTSTVPEIVTAFEEMCKQPLKRDMILFETGTYDFTGELMFYFCLVRQYPKPRSDEYYQIHVRLLFPPDEANRDLHCVVWDEEIEEDMFDYIRASEAYAYAQSAAYAKLEIYKDAT